MKQFIIFLTALSTLLIVTSCNQKTGPSNQDPISNQDLFSHIILDYTQGETVPGSPVRIVFKDQVVTKEETGKALDHEKLKFDPVYPGTLKWESESVLMYQPNQAIFNTKFKGSLDLSKLLGNMKDDEIPDEPFLFEFHTYPLELTMLTEPMQIRKKLSGEGTEVQIKGKMMFNASIDSMEIESLLLIETPGSDKANVSWNHNQGVHSFSISGIERTSKEQTLILRIDAPKDLGLENDFEKRFLIPAEGSFEVINAVKNPDSDREVIISFSDLLDMNQDFNGLIGFKDEEQNIQYRMVDNTIHLLFRYAIEGNKELYVSKSIKSVGGKKLGKAFETNIFFSTPKPAVKLLSKGVISAEIDEVVLPFEVINLTAVDVEISKVYENNMLQFLQYSNLQEKYLPREVSEIIWQGKVDLSELGGDHEFGKWKRYGLNLMNFIAVETGALYNVKIGFRKSYTDYLCDEGYDKLFKEAGITQLPKTKDQAFQTIWRGWYSYSNRSWNDRDDPCKPMFYTSDRFVEQNIFASNMGIMAKYDNKKMLYTTIVDLRTGEPRSGIHLSFYSFQQQKIGEAITDNNGFAEINVGAKAFFVIANDGDEYGYLKLNNYQTLSMSEFDVKGKKTVDGIDGSIFAERGVWRPGDTIFLQFVLRDPNDEIPSGHPITMTLSDPTGKERTRITTAKHTGPFYDFTCSTDANSITGNWRVNIAVGPRNYSKTLKIETVKPNRLKINMEIPDRDVVLNRSAIDMQVNWLTGLPGSELEVDVDANLRSVKTKFNGYPGFRFDDVTRKFNPVEINFFQGKMDDDGRASIPVELNDNYRYPGKINALLKVRAYEPSGEYSSNSFSAQISPYSAYVGLQFPKSRWGRASIKTNEKYDIPVATVDAEGKPNPNTKLTVGIYEAQWNWWWDDSGYEMAQYNSDKHLNAFRKFDLTTDASGKSNIELELEDYGSYMIRICDTESGHCTGQLFYTGSYGGGQETAKEFASMLKFSSDKEVYNKGDEVELRIPAGKNARVLISIETDGEVLLKEWVRSESDVLKYSFSTTETMFPNAYAHVVVVQGLKDRQNDMPYRQYGVLNIPVNDPARRIEPVISMKDVIRPAKPYEVSVSEANWKEMFYTLAVVDDGLLDLTRFKTPALYDHFFAKRAMLTKNWDNFNDVIGTDPGLLDHIVSIGGDDAVEIQNNQEKANRFVPVVEFLGPFKLARGEKMKHELAMGNYSGSVRVMLVGATSEAYGSSDKTVTVKDDVMALITAPRVLSPAETIELPVTVFVTNPQIKSVEVSLQNEEMFDVEGDRSQLLKFRKPGEQVCYFNLKSKESEGIGRLEIIAKGANNIAKQKLEIQIENPNVYQRSSEILALPPGATREFTIPLIGTEGTNFAELELSRLPALGIEERVGSLLRYPYGCIEQTTSAVFPQLYLEDLVDLSQDRQNRIKLHIKKGISKLKDFQLPNKGLSYWPGNRSANSWGSVYAAHFLVEARLKGYNTSSVLPGLLKYMEKEAKNYRIKNSDNLSRESHIIIQAYRTMVLSKAGKPQFGAMNYLYKYDRLPELAKWYLSMAYSFAGKKDIARQLVVNHKPPKKYYYNYYHYGSHLRDYAVLLMALDEAGLKSKASETLLQMVKEYKANRYWSTQTLAWFLNSVGQHVGREEGADLDFIVELKEGTEEIVTSKPVYVFSLGENDIKGTTFRVSNKAETDLFVNPTVHGKPVMGDEGGSSQQNLNFNVKYVDEQNNPLDVSTLKIGTEFKAVVTVSRKGLTRYVEELALSQVLPSGWEILNWRMEGEKRSDWRIEYQDIRDDRVYSFFDLRDKPVKIEIPLHASYVGNFYLPQAFLEAMYEDDIYARKAGQWVKVVR